MEKQFVVIGGGAAGIFCAVNAARMNPVLKVTVLEKSNKLLAKVKISGGGRCNVTHACFDIADMSRQYPRGERFMKKAFHRFFTRDTILWFEERGVKLKTEKDGRMFPVTDSSQTIIDCLLSEAGKYGVEILMKKEVNSISNQNNKWSIQTSDSMITTPGFLCIATGGYPKTAMFDWMKETGHTIEEPVPSLFTFNLPGHPLNQLMGVSIPDARIRIAGSKLEEEGPLMVTHWGLSGPTVLRLSAWGAKELKIQSYEFKILISWLPAYDDQGLRDEFQRLRSVSGSKKIFGKNSFNLPARLWEFLAVSAGVNEQMRWADLPSAVQNKFIKNLCSYESMVKGKTTFKEEFVTAGGIKLNEVDPGTMMSRKLPNLFFAGEVMDVDGITGGFNFQHAWTSGWVAAASIAEMSR